MRGHEGAIPRPLPFREGAGSGVLPFREKAVWRRAVVWTVSLWQCKETAKEPMFRLVDFGLPPSGLGKVVEHFFRAVVNSGHMAGSFVSGAIGRSVQSAISV